MTTDGTIHGTTKVVDNGPDELRWNVVVLGDGYLASELPTFASDVQSFINTLKATPPYDALWAGINVHRIDIESTDSGADDPTECGGTGGTARTYLDATFCAGGPVPDGQRILTVNETTAKQVAYAAVPATHIVVIIVNSPIYGGSGGPVATFSKHAQSLEIALHEMGHTAFQLADEYADPGNGVGGDSYAGAEPSQPNVTGNPDRATIKWNSLLTAGVPVPTTSNGDCSKKDERPSTFAADTVGAFEGAQYFHCGLYRPEYDCRMRTLGQPFCAVCREEITRTIFPHLPEVPSTPPVANIA
jgi:hypothetical protein